MSMRSFNVSHRWECIKVINPTANAISVMQCNVCFEKWFDNEITNCVCVWKCWK